MKSCEIQSSTWISLILVILSEFGGACGGSEASVEVIVFLFFPFSFYFHSLNFPNA